MLGNCLYYDFDWKKGKKNQTQTHTHEQHLGKSHVTKMVGLPSMKKNKNKKDYILRPQNVCNDVMMA